MRYHLSMIAHFLYFIIVDDLTQFKIGFSKHPKKRLKEIQTSIGKTVKLLIEHPIDDKECCMFIEKRLHLEYKQYKARREATEWFDLQSYLIQTNQTITQSKETFVNSINNAIKVYNDSKTIYEKDFL